MKIRTLALASALTAGAATATSCDTPQQGHQRVDVAASSPESDPNQSNTMDLDAILANLPEELKRGVDELGAMLGDLISPDMAEPKFSLSRIRAKLSELTSIAAGYPYLEKYLEQFSNGFKNIMAGLQEFGSGYEGGGIKVEPVKSLQIGNAG